MNNFELLEGFMENHGNNPIMPTVGVDDQAIMQPQAEEFNEYYKAGKKFYLSVEKSQEYYDSFPNEKMPLCGDFKLPFDTTTVIFQKSLKINWIDKEGVKDKECLLMGAVIRFVDSIDIENDGNFDHYGVHLIFDDGFFDKKKESKIISNQRIIFSYNKTGTTEYKPLLTFPNHYPCRNKEGCMAADEHGLYKKWVKEDGQFMVCQEITNRSALVSCLVNLIDKIHESKVEHKTKKTNGHASKKVSLVLGRLKIKDKLPAPNYALHLNGKHHKYNPDEIDYGTGTKHRYKYDVRRHPRIVKGKITWVDPYQRGSGKYVPKVYVNRGTWFINYLWYQTERLTKYRMLEILFIKLTRLWRGFNKRK